MPSDSAFLYRFESLALPVVHRLQKNLYAASFSVMKLLPARAIIEDAITKGELTPGTSHVIESTSGTFGLALAMLKSHYNYELTLVSDPVIDEVLMKKLIQLGANVDIVEHKIAGGYQLARLARIEELKQTLPHHFFTNQYHNPMNRAAYVPCAEHLLRQIGRVDILVATVGTGGSASGTIAALRAANPATRLVGVDTFGSVLFGMPNASRNLRGLGNSILPSNVCHELFDEIHWVTNGEANQMARELHRQYGLFQGPTSGAAFLVADYIRRTEPNANVAVMMPDDGSRYIQTTFSDAAELADIPAAPVELTHPAMQAQWSMMHWRRSPAIPLMMSEAA